MLRAIARDARGRKVFHDLAAEEKEHLGKLEGDIASCCARPAARIAADVPLFQGRGEWTVCRRADRLIRGVNDQQALLIGIRCERGSHRFFKKYGERFEDSEGKQIFLEFADEERAHLDLLVREYRALVKRQGRTRKTPPRGSSATPRASAR